MGRLCFKFESPHEQTFRSEEFSSTSCRSESKANTDACCYGKVLKPSQTFSILLQKAGNEWQCLLFCFDKFNIELRRFHVSSRIRPPCGLWTEWCLVPTFRRSSASTRVLFTEIGIHMEGSVILVPRRVRELLPIVGRKVSRYDPSCMCSQGLWSCQWSSAYLGK